MKYFLVVALLIIAHAAKGDIYKCKNDKGGIAFQDTPCFGLKPLKKPVLSRKTSLDFLENTAGIDEINSKFKRKHIAIDGDKKYKSHVSKCLNLIKSRSIEDYDFIVKYIGIIKQNPKSGMQAWKSPPIFLLSDKSAFHSLTWCASAIAHDAYHSYLYQQNKPVGGGHPPYESWGGFSAERKCNQYQISVMRKIGSSESDIKYLEGQDGTHGDTNKDGKLDKTDHEGVDW